MEIIRNRLVVLCRELDSELDGVLVPSSAAAILNAIRSLLAELDSAQAIQGHKVPTVTVETKPDELDLPPGGEIERFVGRTS